MQRMKNGLTENVLLPLAKKVFLFSCNTMNKVKLLDFLVAASTVATTIPLPKNVFIVTGSINGTK